MNKSIATRRTPHDAKPTMMALAILLSAWAATDVCAQECEFEFEQPTEIRLLAELDDTVDGDRETISETKTSSGEQVSLDLTSSHGRATGTVGLGFASIQVQYRNSFPSVSCGGGVEGEWRDPVVVLPCDPELLGRRGILRGRYNVQFTAVVQPGSHGAFADGDIEFGDSDTVQLAWEHAVQEPVPDAPQPQNPPGTHEVDLKFTFGEPFIFIGENLDADALLLGVCGGDEMTGSATVDLSMEWLGFSAVLDAEGGSVDASVISKSGEFDVLGSCCQRCPAGDESCCTPAPVAVRVDAAGGLFADETKWREEEVPGAGQQVLVGAQGSHTISFTGDVQNDRIILNPDNGVIELALSGNTYTLSEASGCSASFHVDGFSNGTNRVLISNGDVVAKSVLVTGDTSELFLGPGSRLDSTACTVGASQLARLNVAGQSSLLAEQLVIGPGTSTGHVNIARDADVQLFSGSADSTVFLVIGDEGQGELRVDAGGQLNLFSSGSTVVAESSGSQGTLRILGEANLQGTLTIGDEGQGQVVVESGGALSSDGDTVVARTAQARGLMNIRGTAELAGAVVVGQEPQSQGTIQLSGTAESLAVLGTTEAIIGSRGIGKLEATRAQLRIDTVGLVLGQLAGGNGEVTLNAESRVDVRLLPTVIGQRSTGTMRMADGSLLETRTLSLGQDGGANGAVEVVGRDNAGTVDGETDTILRIEAFTVVGEDGEGALTVREGGIVLSGQDEVSDQTASSIAARRSSRGTATITGDGSQWQTRTLNVGFGGRGELRVQDNAVVFSEEGTVGSPLGAGEELPSGDVEPLVNGQGTVEITGGGQWRIAGQLSIGAVGAGSVNVQDGGQVTCTTLETGPLASINGRSRIVVGSAVGAASARSASQNASDGGIFTQNLIINKGSRLDVSEVVVTSDGTIGGDGDLQFDLVNPGIMQPGRDQCTSAALVIQGNYTQASTGELHIKLGGSQPGTTHDILQVEGTADLAGTLAVEAIDGFVPEAGAQFDILTAQSITGAFDEVVGSGDFELAYSGDRVLLTVVTAPTLIGERCPRNDDVGLPAVQLESGPAGLCGAAGPASLLLMLAGLIALRPTAHRCGATRSHCE